MVVSNIRPLTPSEVSVSGRLRLPCQKETGVFARLTTPVSRSVPNSVAKLLWSTFTQIVRDSADETYCVAVPSGNSESPILVNSVRACW